MARTNTNGKESNSLRQEDVAEDREAVKAPLDARALFFLILAIFVFVLIAAAYAWIAKATSVDTPLLFIDVIDRTSIFRADDGYRFFIAKSAWQHIGAYAWNYVLPLCVLFDGILTTLVHKDLFLARCTHIVPAFLTLWFVYKAGVGLNISRTMMVLSVFILAVMPLYAFVFLSFYGENWLALLVAATLCAFVYKHYTLCALVAAFMPLTRPEGFFLMLPLALFFLKERQFRNFILIGMPGFFHFISIFFILDNFSDYLGWRLRFRQVSNTVYSGALYGNYLLGTFNPLWTLPAVVACFLPGMRRLWPIWSGVCVWLAWVSLSLMFNQLYYEARYFLSVLPVIAIAWAYFFSWAGRLPVFAVARTGWMALFSLLFVFIVFEHLLQFDPLKARYGAGQRWPFSGSPVLVDRFAHYPVGEQQSRERMVSAIYGVIEKNPEVDSLIIFSDNIFRVLDPGKIPPRVRVSWAPMSSEISLDAAQNNFYVIHPDDKQYAIYHFQTLDRRHKTPVALYVGDRLPCQLCMPIFSTGSYSLYAFSYSVSDDVKLIPPKKITLDCVRLKDGSGVCR